jgi:hypothetical protein
MHGAPAVRRREPFATCSAPSTACFAETGPPSRFPRSVRPSKSSVTAYAAGADFRAGSDTHKITAARILRRFAPPPGFATSGDPGPTSQGPAVR